MSKSSKSSLRNDSGVVEVKSKFDAEFRRFSVDRGRQTKFADFKETVERIHFLKDHPFTITYTDIHGDLLPINNDDNFNLAIFTAKPALRINVQKKGESYGELNGYGTVQKRKKPLTKILSSDSGSPRARIPIGLPEDFRRVSAIIDVDVVPETHRRVKLMKNGSDKPLGFYIRDGTSVRVTPQGLDKVPGIYISRLVPGGLAESTGLLAVNDEVLEVNGIEVHGKTLDQVTDMMVANSSNLIITVKPVNQRLTLAPQRGGVGRYSQMSQASHLTNTSGHSRQSSKSYDSDMIPEQDDEDEVQDYLNKSSSKSDQSSRSDKSERSRVSDPAEKLTQVEKLNKSDRSYHSNRSNGSSGNRSNGSGPNQQANGSGRNQKAGGSGRSQGSGSGSGRQKHEGGGTKGASDGPMVTL
ncbi:partitioning defective protein 6-like [Mya arenaria]|nr:partitioning defective protein 6-like [Mya arenaria]